MNVKFVKLPIKGKNMQRLQVYHMYGNITKSYNIKHITKFNSCMPSCH